jgi:hypothetical protein
MSALRSLSCGMYGAWRFARLDRGAMLWFDRGIDGLWRSFWAAAVAYPGFIVLLVLRTAPAQWQASGGWRVLAVETIGYVIGWTLFPLVILPFCRWLGRAGEAIDFIIAYNWSQVLQTGLFLGLAALEGGGLMPGAAAGPIFGLAFLAVLAYEWFIARVALDAGGVAATAVVLIDLVLNAVVQRVTLSLY